MLLAVRTYPKAERALGGFRIEGVARATWYAVKTQAKVIVMKLGGEIYIVGSGIFSQLKSLGSPKSNFKCGIGEQASEA